MMKDWLLRPKVEDFMQSEILPRAASWDVVASGN